MKATRFLLGGAMAAVMCITTMVAPTAMADDEFTLARYVPSDVFLFTAEKSNPERDFLASYWDEVFNELEQTGVHEDVLDLFSAVVGLSGTDQAAKIEELRERAMQLIAAVDWEDLGGKEVAFIERITPLTQISRGNPAILMPDMVVMLRGSKEGAARNFEGLTAILEAIIGEINNAVGAEILDLVRTTRSGIQVARTNLFGKNPGAPSLPLALALRDDVIVIGMREELFSDVLAIMEGSSRKTRLVDDTRFKSAFAGLPPAEDTLTFFNMQTMLKPLRASIQTIIGMEAGPRDIYVHSGMKAEVNGTNADAMTAYQSGDVEKALALTRKAYEKAPDNCIILYNLACFNTITGNRDEGLDWLQKAVDAGFYASRKIAGDADLESLHEEPRYKAALAKATEMAARHAARDVAVNFASEGEVFRLRMLVHKTYETRDYDQGLKLIKQAYAIGPDDSKVIYTMACLHTLLGHEDEGLDCLEQSVDAGFYCPEHMGKDSDLESVRNHPRFKAAVAKARKYAEDLAVQKMSSWASKINQLIDRVADAIGILDYSATVETTDGYTAKTESLVELVPDAGSRPIYALFGRRPLLTDFDRYLPQETVSFSISGGIDLGALYEFIRETIAMIGPEGEMALAKLDEIQKQFGIDIRRDVIDWIDGDTISVTLADDGGSVTLFKVKDEETARQKIGAAIEFGSTKLMEVVSKNPALAGLAMMRIRTSPVKHEKLEGFQNIHFAMSPEPVVWGVADGYVIFGTSADAVALCLATARGDHPNIRSNTSAMSEAIVPAGPFAAMNLSNMRTMGEDIASGLEVGSMVCGMVGAFIPEPKARPLVGKIANILGKLAPVARKVDFYKSSASCTTFDGQTWHSRSVTHYFSPDERK